LGTLLFFFHRIEKQYYLSPYIVLLTSAAENNETFIKADNAETRNNANEMQRS
jgi:hypothetical protein